MKAVFLFQFLRIYKELAKNITFALPRNKKRIGETRSRPELGFRPFFLYFSQKIKKMFCRYKKHIYICSV